MVLNDLIQATATVVAAPHSILRRSRSQCRSFLATTFLGGFGEIDDRFEGLDLAEEKLVPGGSGAVPMLQELASELSDP